MKKSVLFICTHNSARSQMAEGFLRSMYPDRYEVASAGTIASHVNPYAIEVMKEIGIDISNHRSKSIEEFKRMSFDYVITVCDKANETCPFFPGKVHIHRNFEDPALAAGSDEEKLKVFRKVRDEIRAWIEENFGKGMIDSKDVSSFSIEE
ncbi:MAG: arsenate reductase ArsC [Athalassotoga sp.]|uniref:arsenate reductase ArsC n=1 Tax=Athalassotoga sp. TaxID=2022597 RepID=UPI003CFCCA5C